MNDVFLHAACYLLCADGYRRGVRSLSRRVLTPAQLSQRCTVWYAPKPVNARWARWQRPYTGGQWVELRALIDALAYAVGIEDNQL